MPEHSHNQNDTDAIDDELLRREQNDSVFRQLRLVLGVDAVSGSMLAAFTLAFAESIYVGTYLWIAALYLYCAIFYLAGKPQISHPSNESNARSRERFLLAMVVLSGVIWGCTWLLAPLSASQLVVAPKGATIIWFCVMLANATIFLSVNLRLFLGFSVTGVAIHVGFSAYMGAEQDYRIAGALIVILLFSYFMAARINENLNSTIQLRRRNKELNAKLIRETEVLEQREAELTMRIEREETLLLEKQDADNKLAMAAEEKLLLLDAVSEGILGINKLGNISFVNAMALQLLKFDESELIGESAIEILLRNNTEIGKVATTRKSLNLCLFKSETVRSVDGVFCGKGDVLLPARFSCRPITERGELIGAVVSFQDMSQQLEMEAKLLQSEKMEAIGRITGGVAHDFNNLLTVIMGNLQLLRRRLDKDARHDDIERVDSLLKAAQNGAEMNKRLLSFSRDKALVSKSEDINAVLRDMESFMRGALGEDIALHLTLSDGGEMAKIDKTQFENVIINLCVNARDAMATGGELKIATRRVKREIDRGAELANSETADFVELSVVDNGQGIPTEIQGKVFDPFFTTKEMGSGSGFGLSTAFGFMQQSGGSIDMQSQPGEGTCFTLLFPLTDEQAEPSTAQDKGNESTEGSYSGTILLVEDDAGVREVAMQMLLDAGYSVISAKDGNSGLEQFRQNGDIDLVFSDIMMPGGMNGIDMAKRILEEQPDTPILLATGYAEQSLKDRLEESAKLICISKPYNTEKLPELIHSMMSQG